MTTIISGFGLDITIPSNKQAPKKPVKEVSQDVQRKVLKLPRGVNVGRVIGSDGQMMYWIDEKTLAQRLDAAGIAWEFED